MSADPMSSMAKLGMKIDGIREKEPTNMQPNTHEESTKKDQRMTCSATVDEVELPFQYEDQGALRLGDTVPDFACNTTKGRWESFQKWKEGKWAILCSHPAAFTPVCTTEILEVAEKYDSFAKRDCKVAFLSVDEVALNHGWMQDVLALSSTVTQIPFPIIADPTRTIASLYGMINLMTSDPQKLPATIRVVFFINPDNKIMLMHHYPVSVGVSGTKATSLAASSSHEEMIQRNVDEMIRCVEALQMASSQSVATPVNWPQNNIAFPVHEDDLKGAVFIPPSVSQEDAERRFPGFMECPMPSGRKYLRLVKYNGLSGTGKENEADTIVSRARQVDKWPGHLPLLKVRVFVNEDYGGAKTNRRAWLSRGNSHAALKQTEKWLVRAMDSKMIEIGLIVLAAVSRQFLMVIAIAAVACGMYLLSTTTGRLRAKTGNGLFLCFWLELSFETGRTCLLKRTENGITLLQGNNKLEPSAKETFVWEFKGDGHAIFRLAQVRFFVEQLGENDSSSIFQRGKSSTYNFLTKLLRIKEKGFESYDDFCHLMTVEYCRRAAVSHGAKEVSKKVKEVSKKVARRLSAGSNHVSKKFQECARRISCGSKS